MCYFNASQNLCPSLATITTTMVSIDNDDDDDDNDDDDGGDDTFEFYFDTAKIR